MLTCLYLGWFAPKGLIKAQLTNEGSIRSRIVPLLIFVLRWIAPVAIATIFVSQFLK
jgi:NSS family neurotransmitter:Na+ symporter